MERLVINSSTCTARTATAERSVSARTELDTNQPYVRFEKERVNASVIRV